MIGLGQWSPTGKDNEDEVAGLDRGVAAFKERKSWHTVSA